jgi:hypothetical protein
MRIILCARIALYPSLTLCPVLVVFRAGAAGGQVREFGTSVPERVFS